MRIRDEAFWQGQKAEIAQSDGEDGKAFLTFLEAWCDKAELVLGFSPTISGAVIVETLREALISTEDELGVLPPRWMAHMLLVMMGSWAYWEPEVFEALTFFEKRMIADEAAIVNEELQESAN